MSDFEFIEDDEKPMNMTMSMDGRKPSKSKKSDKKGDDMMFDDLGEEIKQARDERLNHSVVNDNRSS